MRHFILLCLVLIGSLNGCSSETVYAPVTEIAAIDPIPQNGTYQVRADDTLYSIAWRYGLDYQKLANMNHIAKPYHIEVGEVLRLGEGTSRLSPVVPIKSGPLDQQRTTPKKPVSATPPTTTPVSLQEQKIDRAPLVSVKTWLWPVKGPVIGTFSQSNKGLNISGIPGTPIHATAAGVVVYQGNALKAYGNLIIIKHNSTFLSAYAHNKTILVKEGDRVHAGQKIAEMGDTGSRRTMLHFEIRRKGKPVNPLSYLGR